LIDLTPNATWILQAFHVFLGSWMVLVATLAHCPLHRAFLAATAIAAVKEFGWDMFFERTTWTEEAQDFVFYLCGIAATAVALAWLHSIS
jgi:hypothetical protein